MCDVTGSENVAEEWSKEFAVITRVLGWSLCICGQTCLIN